MTAEYPPPGHQSTLLMIRISIFGHMRCLPTLVDAKKKKSNAMTF